MGGSEVTDMLKKSDAIKVLDMQDEADRQALEKACDDALAKYDGQHVVRVYTGGRSRKAIDAIKAAYSAPGVDWKVEEVAGAQTDIGPTLHFS
jgi:hypothetical protein